MSEVENSVGHRPDGKWAFDKNVTDVFTDMLRRSIPDYDTMRLKATAWTEELSRAAANVLAALEAHLQERRLQHQSGSL